MKTHLGAVGAIVSPAAAREEAGRAQQPQVALEQVRGQRVARRTTTRSAKRYGPEPVRGGERHGSHPRRSAARPGERPPQRGESAAQQARQETLHGVLI